MSQIFSLAALREAPQPTPERFLRYHPGCHVQYYDDTPTRNTWKALSARAFDPEVARSKQLDRCAVCYSLQAFGASRTKRHLLCYRNLGVDVDLVAAADRATVSPAEITRRKQAYLTRRLLPFPLSPHWLTETHHGFHLVFRVLPLREPARVREAEAVNRRLVRALCGDEHAALLTQVLRVPGTLQFKGQPPPFRCLLLVDNADSLPPYDVRDVGAVLDACETFQPAGKADTATAPHRPAAVSVSSTWREALGGVAEGGRNAAAAALAGAILLRLPEDLWDTAGWGGLKEWNTANVPPLPERELRAVFASIARREREKRNGRGRAILDAEGGRTAGADGMRPRQNPPSPR